MTVAAREDLARAIDEIKAAVAEAAPVFRNAPNSNARPGEPWGAKEIIAHLIWWNEFSLDSVERVRAGGEAQAATRPTDELNADAVAAMAGKPMVALTDDLEASVQQLIAAMQKLPDPSVTVMRRPNGQAFDAAGRLRVIAGHIRDHLGEIR